MLTTYVKIIEATKPVFGRFGEEIGAFLMVYVSPDAGKLKSLPDRGFRFGAYKEYVLEDDPKFFSLRVEEQFGNSAFMDYSNFVWEFCLPAENRAELEKLLATAV